MRAGLFALLLAAASAPPGEAPTWRGQPISHWLRALSEPTSSADERWLASQALGELLRPGVSPEARAAALPALLAALEAVDENPSAAARATELLLLYGPEAAPASDALLAILSRNARSTPRQQAQVAAARALVAIGRLSRPGAFVLGRTAATAPSPAVRAACLAALGRLAEPRDSVPLLADALSDPSGEVRWTAACALAELGSAARDALPALRTALQEPPRVQSRFLAWVQQVFPRYSDDYRSTAAAAAALISLGDEETGLDALRSHLAHDDWLVRQAALEALFAARSSGADLVLPLLVQALDDARAPVRRKAASLIGRLGGPAAPAAALLALRAAEDPDATVRLAAFEAASLTASRAEVIQLASGRLSDPALALRLAAVGQLARLTADAAARDALRGAAADPDPDVREAAELALASRGRR